ncbi:MAG: NmrA family NAD(P)-binding protein [Bacteroidota bacterium]|nr:NmrA family NAD(P)-binding protein [Bacteroidota bacterium]
MKEKILITTATGKTGFATAAQLLHDGYPVRAYVRSRNRKAVQLEQLGAELAIGEIDNSAQLRAALAGVQRVYYCYPFKPGMPADVRLFIAAAQEARVEAVVFMGQWLAEFDDQVAAQTLNTREAYRLFEQSGLHVVCLVPGYFAENTIGVLLEFAVQLGILVSPFGAGKNPVPSNEDLAAVLVALLKNPAPYYGQHLRPTGPKSLSMPEMAAVISRVVGKKIRVVPAPEWLFLKAAFRSGKDFGYDAFTIAQARFYNQEYQANKFDIGGPTDVVRRVAGKAPDDFETIVRRFIGESAYGMPSAQGWRTALRKFMAVPLQSVPSRKELERLNR